MPKKTKRKDENQKPLPRAEHDKRALKKQHNVKQQKGWGITKNWRKRGFELALGLERAGNHCWNSLMRSANARRSGRRRAPDAAAAVECLMIPFHTVAQDTSPCERWQQQTKKRQRQRDREIERHMHACKPQPTCGLGRVGADFGPWTSAQQLALPWHVCARCCSRAWQ